MSTTTVSPSPHATPQQLAAWIQVPHNLDLRCDLAVVGGGIGGVCAAVAAARRGLSVVIVEDTHMLGGQATTSGVSAMDVTYFYEKALTEYGLWGEITKRIQKIYDDELDRPVNVCRYRLDSFGANVVVTERVLTEMVEEAGVRCLRNTTVTEGILSKDRTILYTNRGHIKAGIAIDATEDGSLIALMKIPHRIGNTRFINQQAIDEQFHRIPIQDITQVAVIRRLPDGEEIPESLRLHEAPPLYERYRAEVTRAFPDAPGHQKVHPNGFAGYRAVPDLASEVRYTGEDWEIISRTALNYHNDLAIAADYLTSAESREDYEVHAIYRTLAILYYLQVELGQPWIVADDEGYADGPSPARSIPGHPELDEILKHFPPRPYIRESRRILGKDTITGKDIYRSRNHGEARWNVDSIAVGTYPPDLHGGRKNENLEADLEETLADKPNIWREGPFPIPLGTLIPAKANSFIAAEKNISSSRIAAGAIRLHPTVAATGEAAGVLAALSTRDQMPVSKVPVLSVQTSLIAGGALLAPMYIEGVDSAHPDFLPVTLAVARQLVEIEIVRPDHSTESFLRVDLALAARRGRGLLETLDEPMAPEAT